MNKRILASIKKDVKIILKSWRSHGASILFMVAILIFVMFTTESNYPELNEEVFSLGKPRVENVLLIIPFVFSFIILQPINQELFYRERVGKNFETAFATPLKKEELWLSKVLLSTTIGFIYYSISIAIVILSVKLFFPNMWFVLTSLGVLPIANSAF